MEIGDDGDGTRTPAPPSEAGGYGDRPSKRMMKSPFQLEMLEKTYLIDPYPPETMRADLSSKIGLTDRQLQMWFCHRRLKDRKPNSSNKKSRHSESQSLSPPFMPPPPVLPPVTESHMSVPVRGPSRPSSAMPPVTESLMTVPIRGPSRPAAVARLGPPRYYEPALMNPPVVVPMQLSTREMRAVANVERLLGGPLREDGPILGIEFEPLPPGAFGAPLVPEQQKQPSRPYESKLFARHDPKTIKASAFLPSMDSSFNSPHPSYNTNKRKTPSSSYNTGTRAPHEYQFLPEQPTVPVPVPLPPVSHHHFYESPAPNPKPSYTFQGQIASSAAAPVLTPPIRTPQVFSTPPICADYEAGQTGQTVSGGSSSYGNAGVVSEGQFGGNISDSKRVVNHEDEAIRMERKRKSEEARIAKEVEAHEKRIRRELEKQDMLKRKREEQVRKEMERQDRERKKEEERLLRERLREEERFQREQKKELERREKFLIKESLRAEKQRQKDEMRKEKEAARQKAATERATARKIAKEYMELIEDERLELMEIAAHNKGLPSMLSLDSETLNQLHSFRDMLTKFPPDSIKLKRPFAIEPWTRSEDNVGDLLMVWKFLITFADVLGLWPFTLDEFVQALHDYESRLLGEIHVSLLKGIIKDIEDVARAPAVTLGANQSNSANPSGGHPQLVEGAYAWGFSIRKWQKHLNYLTWPEILRQFALSAGFGPQLKKRTVDKIYYHEDNEGEDGESVIMTLRNGSAAENAVALMKERGYSHGRKSRHRLTPGTVKFAAFHVLSLEGSHGLTILEVADKIQRSGLRDLTTSKTPEASIAAALSRDVKLFERTAPSTYCVRSPYRKDPANAEEILSAALEKIKSFQNTLSDSDTAGKDVVDHEDADGDDVIIRDEEDSECEVDAEDPPDGNDVNMLPKSGNNNNVPVAGDSSSSTPVTNSAKPPKPSESLPKPNKTTVFPSKSTPINTIEEAGEETEIDESNYGEAWVQGLSEGDYCELSVEEKLKALVALIRVATEGNSIRAVLEERLEAANALKKQMWAEAQLDKRRLREECTTKIQFPSSSHHPNGHITTDTNPNNTPNAGPTCNTEDPSSHHPSSNNNNNLDAMNQYGHAEKTRSEQKAYIGHKAEQLYEYRSLPLGQDRRRNRYWVFSTSGSPYDPGSGRIFFESRDGCWRVIDSEEVFHSLMAALDTRGIRESNLHSMLLRIEPTFKEAIKKQKSLNNPETTSQSPNSINNNNLSDSSSTSTLICASSENSHLHSNSFKIELGRSEREKAEIMKRYNTFLKWMWAECFENHALSAKKYGEKRGNCSELVLVCDGCYKTYLGEEERHCSCCHEGFRGYDYVNFGEHVRECEERRERDPSWSASVVCDAIPLGIKLLKAKLAIVEVSLPAEALQPFWTEGYRKSWGVRLQNSTSAEEIFQMLTLLEGTIKQEYLSSSFETTAELLNCSNSSYINPFDSVNVLSWVPETVTAVALRLFDLDSSVSYAFLEKNESFRDKQPDDFLNFPSRYATPNSMQDLHPHHLPNDPLDFPSNGMMTPGGRRGRGRGRGTRGGITPRGRGRGGRPPKHLTPASSAREDNPYLKPKRSYTRRGGRPRGSTSRGRRRGRRSIRPRQGGRGGVTIPKESLLGSFGVIGNVDSSNKMEEFVPDTSRSSGEEGEERLKDLNGEMSAEEYGERMASESRYSGDYVNEEEDEEEEDGDLGDGNNGQDEEEEEEDGGYGEGGYDGGVQFEAHHVGDHDDVDDDDVEMMDEDEDGNGNAEEDDGGYSDYSD